MRVIKFADVNQKLSFINQMNNNTKKIISLDITKRNMCLWSDGNTN